MIKAFIFDLGKVIIPYDHDRGLRILEQKCSHARDHIRAGIFASRELELYQTGKLSSREFFEAIKKILKLEMDFAEFAEVWNHTFTFTPLIEEAFIENLSKNYRLLVLSDTNEMHFEFILEKFPILRHFDDFVLSYRVGLLKPSKEIFRIAVNRANCLPEECVFTDDLPENAEAARKIGINAFQFFDSERFRKDLEKIIALRL